MTNEPIGGHRRPVARSDRRHRRQRPAAGRNGRRSPGHRSTRDKARRCRRHRLADRYGGRIHGADGYEPHTPRPEPQAPATVQFWRRRRHRHAGGRAVAVPLTLTADEWAVLERDRQAWIVRDDPAELVAAAAPCGRLRTCQDCRTGCSEWRDCPEAPGCEWGTVTLGCAYADSEVQMIWRPGVPAEAPSGRHSSPCSVSTHPPISAATPSR